MQRVYILVFGQVQGVFFRHTTKKEAEELGLKGFVRNVGDDKVEIVAEGEEEKLKELIDWCHKGPPLSKIEKLEVKWQKPIGGFSEFNITF